MRRIAILLLVALTISAGVIVLRSGGAYAAQDRNRISEGASTTHWAGTDDLGRDRLIRVAVAMLVGLAGAVAASALATSISVGLGVGAAFVPEFAASILLYISDLLLTLPWLFLLMIVRSALPLNLAPMQSAATTFLLLALLGWPIYVRVNYAGALRMRNSDWLVYGRASGLRTSRLVRRHVLPHLFPLLMSQFLITIPACLIAEANLGTMGLGISEPMPSWGSMLMALESSAIVGNTGWVYLPIALLVTVLLLLEALIFEVSR